MTPKEKSDFKRQRAKWELSLRLNQLLNDFKSKEEPTIKLTHKDKMEVLSQIVTNGISRLLNPKK